MINAHLFLKSENWIDAIEWVRSVGRIVNEKKNINLLLPNPIFAFLICDSSCDKKIKEKNI